MPTMPLPEGVRRVDPIDEGGLLVCLTHEVDLDELLVALAAWDPDMWSGYLWNGDWPTEITTSYHRPEPEVGWFRKQPCNCGEEHSWDVAPAEPHARGAFLGVLT